VKDFRRNPKSQAPNSKQKAKLNNRTPINRATFGEFALEFPWDLEFGI
jgi:hypothetical protein